LKYEDRPRLLRDPEALASRLGEIEQAHIAPLTAFVRRLRERAGPQASIPFFDPWDGGVGAEVLLLLEAPGPQARNSGFVSRNNPDVTASNLFELTKEANIARTRTILWNVVPWYIGAGARIRPASAGDISSGIESLDELLSLLPQIRGVALLGRKAQKAEAHIRTLRPNLFVESCPHPSPVFVNRRPVNREVLLSSFRRIQARMERP
jgi:hypothetical protein